MFLAWLKLETTPVLDAQFTQKQCIEIALIPAVWKETRHIQSVEDNMKTQQNEKAKLTAAYLNGIAISVALAGALTPTLTGVQANPGPINWATAVVVAICMLVSASFHLMARRFLSSLVD
ncbi:hypothetical protein [Rhizobium sp. LjRoot258]|uniref:hypothetical protein n=1 Tax=Rhizobium sp. LjRoot258 TaxID=3342299 RepID=UPI003ECFA425